MCMCVSVCVCMCLTPPSPHTQIIESTRTVETQRALKNMEQTDRRKVLRDVVDECRCVCVCV